MKVLICDPISPHGIEILSSSGLDVEYQPEIGRKDLTQRIGDCDAVIVRGRTKLDGSLLERASRLKVIGRAGVGLDNIDLQAAASRQISVLSTPDASTNAVAEHAIALMLALAKNLCIADSLVKKENWPKRQLLGIELQEKTLGLIGMGRIGQRVARLAKAFGMRLLGFDIIAIDRRILEELGVTIVELETLLSDSDFVSIHVPLTEATRHLIDSSKLRLMKRTGFLINTSRGAVVDEEALYEAISRGRIAGAGLDVFETEPPRSRRLITLPNVVCSPHIAGQTHEAQENAGVEIARLVSRALTG